MLNRKHAYVYYCRNILLIGSILLFFSLLAGKTSYKFGVPTLLLFLMVGMIFGSDGVGLQFSSQKTAQFIGVVDLSIIFFSGGMDTRYEEIRPVAKEGVVLATLGVLLTAVFTGFLFIFSRGSCQTLNFHCPYAFCWEA